MNLNFICIICLILVICNLNPVSASSSTVSISDLAGGLGLAIDADIVLNTSDSYGNGTINVNYDPAIIHAVDVQSSQHSTIISIGNFNTNREIVNADIRINTTENYGTGTIIVNYNPSIIHVTDVQGGDYSTVVIWNADNTNGFVNISAWNTTGTCGDFVFATIAFKPVATGKSQLDIEVQLLQDILSNDIPAATSSGSITADMGSSTSSGSSGGGGGGGGTSGEDFFNILISETEREYVNKGSEVSYSFDSEGNIVRYINFTGVTSSGTIAAKVEILNHTSAMVDQAPTDIVYKNLNIWVGNLGWANSRNIASPTINFKVQKSWVMEHNIDKSTVRLNRHSEGNWNPLATIRIGEDAGYLYFEAETLGFSPFAITGSKVSTLSSSDADVESSATGSGHIEEISDHMPEPDKTTAQKEPGFSLFVCLIVVLIVVQILRKNK